MATLPALLKNIDYSQNLTIEDLVNIITQCVSESGYEIAECNNTKPWGAYLRIHSGQADEFVAHFFSELSPKEARLGNPAAELSPKLLIVSPMERLSLQTHTRRAERWRFLTPGFYYKGESLEDTRLYEANSGEVVQFEKGDIHRLCGIESGFVVVAEIWQHTDPDNLSDEDDIVRLEDDYER